MVYISRPKDTESNQVFTNIYIKLYNLQEIKLISVLLVKTLEKRKKSWYCLLFFLLGYFNTSKYGWRYINLLSILENIFETLNVLPRNEIGLKGKT